jgi:hypothetical protein
MADESLAKVTARIGYGPETLRSKAKSAIKEIQYIFQILAGVVLPYRGIL